MKRIDASLTYREHSYEDCLSSRRRAAWPTHEPLGKSEPADIRQRPIALMGLACEIGPRPGRI